MSPTRPEGGESWHFLVLSAAMGSGHDAVAGVLGDRLTAMGHQVSHADVLSLLPAGTGPALRSFYHATIKHLPVLYAGIYEVFFRDGAVPRPGSTPLAALAADALLALTARRRPHVIVSVFHLGAQVAGRLRTRGVLRVPSAVVVTDFAVHRQWLHPGNDLHLCLTSQIADQVTRSVGRPAVASGPLVAEWCAAVLGWVDDMPGLMGAADILIDNAAGQTALQALAAGLPVVSYQPIPGHGAEGVRRMADLGLSEYARGPGQLLSSLQALCPPGPGRDRRIAGGRALFAAGADGAACLESLAPSTCQPRRWHRDRGGGGDGVPVTR